MQNQPPIRRLSLTRRQFIAATAIASAASAASWASSSRPVILDTDIGDDIDDTWALLMLLRMQEMNLKLVVGDFGNPLFRVRLLAKLLEKFNRTDIPIGIGLTLDDGKIDAPAQQSGWLGDYNLKHYPGKVLEDGVQAIIDTIMSSSEPVTLLCLGPVPNIAEALRREPAIAKNAEFVGMHGSINVGYVGSPTPAAEYNVKMAPSALQTVFAAPWECTITPLDTCGLVVLDGDNYDRLYQSNNPELKTLMENYRSWLPGAPFIDPDHDFTSTSTTLFDAVAVHLVAGGGLVNLETLPLRVTSDGYTVVDREKGHPVHCATSWKDLEGFHNQLTSILLPGGS